MPLRAKEAEGGRQRPKPERTGPSGRARRRPHLASGRVASRAVRGGRVWKTEPRGERRRRPRRSVHSETCPFGPRRAFATPGPWRPGAAGLTAMNTVFLSTVQGRAGDALHVDTDDPVMITRTHTHTHTHTRPPRRRARRGRGVDSPSALRRGSSAASARLLQVCWEAVCPRAVRMVLTWPFWARGSRVKQGATQSFTTAREHEGAKVEHGYFSKLPISVLLPERNTAP